MAEVAAGVVVAEVVETAIEGGAIAAYAIAKPTDPLKGTFTRIGSVPSGGESPYVHLVVPFTLV